MVSSRRPTWHSTALATVLLVGLIHLTESAWLEGSTQAPAIVELSYVASYGWNVSQECSQVAPSFLTCDATGYVLSLTLPPTKGGYLPISLGLLTRMTNLTVTSNTFSDVLPVTIGKAVGLRILNLHNNMFSGTLPDGLTLLKSLQSLDLGSNYLTGSVPAGLSTLASLVSIDLSNNYLLGSFTLPPLATCNTTILDTNCFALGAACTSSSAQRPSAVCSSACKARVSQPTWSLQCNNFGTCYPYGTSVTNVISDWSCVCKRGYRLSPSSKYTCVAIPPPPPPRPPPRPPPPSPPPPCGGCPRFAQCVYLKTPNNFACSCLHYWVPVYKFVFVKGVRKKVLAGCAYPPRK